MKINCKANLHFDGDRMAIEVLMLAEDGTTAVFLSHTDVGARVIEFLRAKGLDVYDRRGEHKEPEPEAEPTTPIQLEPSASAGDRPRPLYPEPVESHHVTHADPSLPKPREEISL